MFGYIKRTFGMVTATEKNDKIIVEGVNAKFMNDDFTKLWKTSKIGLHMFEKITKSSFEIPSFYALDLRYMLEKLLETGKSLNVSRRTARQIIDKLNENTWLKNTLNDNRHCLNFEHLNKFNWKPLDHQLNFLVYYDKLVPQYGLNGLILAGAPGSGKAQPLDAPIKVPEGWIKMGDVHVGTVITTPDGWYSMVTGVFPQGDKEVFELLFEDGRSTKACAEHLWKIYIDGVGSVVNTSTLIEYLAESVDVYMDLPQSEQVTHRPEVGEIPIYSSDSESIDQEYLLANHTTRSSLYESLVEHVGLEVSDGSVEFDVVHLSLAQGIQYLARSLGKMASIVGGDEGYCVIVITDGDSKILLTSIESVGVMATQCISIDHPEHLYITDDFIVTHNTILGLYTAECLESDYTIVVSPKLALDKVWRQTLATAFKKTPTYWVSNDKVDYSGQKFIVAHYEYMEKLLEIAKRLKGKITIILDESHNLNEEKSLRTQHFIELCKRTQSKNIIWASGTSFKAQGSESIPIFRTIDPRFTDKVGEAYKKLYGSGGGRALDVLANRIDIMSFKVAKSELKLAEPKMVPIPVKVPNGKDYTLDVVKAEMQAFVVERNKYYASRRSEDQAFYDACLAKCRVSLKRPIELEEYDKYLRDVKTIQKFISDLSQVKDELVFCNRFEKNTIMPVLSPEEAKQFKEVKSIIKYVSLKIQGECLGRILGKKRMECITAVANHIDYAKIIESTEKKTVVFTSYVNVLETTSKKVAELGYSPMVVYGKTNNELAAIVTAFESKPEINPLIATYQSLSTAVPLTVADTMIMVNAPFRDYIHQQAISRIHRIGADTQVVVYIASLDTDGTPNLSTRSIDILAWSQSQVEQIMNMKSPFPVSETGSVVVESFEGEVAEGDGIGISDVNGLVMEGLDIHISFEDIDFVAGLDPITNIDTPDAPKSVDGLYQWSGD